MFNYLEEKEQALQQLAEGSDIIQTRLGEIEVSIAGEGPAVLSLHGTGGGYDMGLAFCFPEEWLIRVVKVSTNNKHCCHHPEMRVTHNL